jgi:hypothetical protein
MTEHTLPDITSWALTRLEIEKWVGRIEGVVIVRVRVDLERFTVWIHVRGGYYSDVMLAVVKLEEFKPAGVHFQLDHAPAEHHHHVIAETPWLRATMKG